MASDQMEECTLDECPPGLFMFGETLCFRSEYSTTLKAPPYAQPDAYVVESGEYFWGGAKTGAERSELLVRPCHPITPADLSAAEAAAAREAVEACAKHVESVREWDGSDYYCDSCKGGAIYPDREDVARDLRALPRRPSGALDRMIAEAEKRGYKEGWNDREGDFLAGTARIGIDDAAIKAARAEGMEAAVKIAQADERTYQGYVGCNPTLIVPRIIAAIRAAKDQPA